MKNKNGFTLVELVVVIVIIGVLALIAVPVFSGFIERANAQTCFANRRQIIRYYSIVTTLEYNKETKSNLSHVLSGNIDVDDEDISRMICPSKGVFTADDVNVEIMCSVHGDVTEDNPDNPNKPQPPQNSQDEFYLGGDENYKVTTKGDIEEYAPTTGYGETINTGSIFSYKGEYYYFRHDQYLTPNTDIPSLVANSSVKINHTEFITPNTDTKPGDVKSVNGKAYVFMPYSRYPNDYLDTQYWFEFK